MEDLFAALRARWSEQGIDHATRATAAELDAWEARHGRTLPAEVRAYFAALNGFDGGKDGPEDNDSVTFWNLSELRPLTEERPEARVPDAASCFIFADNLLWGSYALRLRPGRNEYAEVTTVDEPRPTIVAASLREFLEGYLASDPEILFRMPAVPLTLNIRPANRLRAFFARLFIPDGEIKPRIRNHAALDRRLTRFVNRLVRDHSHLRRRRGAVKLRLRVDERGRGIFMELADPGTIPEIRDEAVRLVDRMRFSPARINRRAVAVLVEVPLYFQFPR